MLGVILSYVFGDRTAWMLFDVFENNFSAWVSEGGQGPPGFKKFQQKACFINFEWEKANFTTFGPSLEKFRKNPFSCYMITIPRFLVNQCSEWIEVTSMPRKSFQYK